MKQLTDQEKLILAMKNNGKTSEAIAKFVREVFGRTMTVNAVDQTRARALAKLRKIAGAS